MEVPQPLLPAVGTKLSTKAHDSKTWSIRPKFRCHREGVTPGSEASGFWKKECQSPHRHLPVGLAAHHQPGEVSKPLEVVSGH
jgi:hypothetical protein